MKTHCSLINLKNLIFLPSLIMLACSPLKKVSIGKINSANHEDYYVQKRDLDVKEGPYLQTFYGVPITEGEYKAGKKNGLWKYHDYSGKVNFSGKYQNGLKDGLWIYYNNASVKSKIYYREGTVDSALAYHENGKRCYEMRLDENKIGFVKSYYKSGTLKDLFPMRGQQIDGTYSLFFENGQLHRETEFKKGYEMKVMKTYDPLGMPIDGGSLADGDGTMILYYLPKDSGNSFVQKYRVDTYREGARNGPSKLYRKNGLLEEEGHYQNGYLSGIWKLYKEDGTLAATVNYEADSSHAVTKTEANILTISECGENIDQSKLEFQGGEKERANFIVKTIQYPARARANNVEGKVFINFVISENGDVLSYKLIKKVNPELDAEVIRLMKLMPRWNPSFYNGVPVKTSYNMPISFKIK